MRLAARAAILGALGIVACGRGPAHHPAHHTVEIRDLAFVPDSVRAAPGDTITWINRDIVPHTVTAAGGRDSGPIAAGAEFRMIVAESGGAGYICAYHPTMRGWIVPE